MLGLIFVYMRMAEILEHIWFLLIFTFVFIIFLFKKNKLFGPGWCEGICEPFFFPKWVLLTYETDVGKERGGFRSKG